MVEVYQGRGYVYSIQYHIVWCVKYRHDVLVNEVDETVKEVIREIAQEHGFSVVEMETEKDHIRLLIECKPQHYIPNIVKAFKGVSARRVFKKHPELKEQICGGHLWNPSYFVSTVSEQIEEQVKEYIFGQKKH